MDDPEVVLVKETDEGEGDGRSESEPHAAVVSVVGATVVDFLVESSDVVLVASPCEESCQETKDSVPERKADYSADHGDLSVEDIAFDKLIAACNVEVGKQINCDCDAGYDCEISY